MKKPLIVLAAAMVLAAGAFAQTQRTNRTNTRTHDRSDAANPGRSTDQQNTTRPDRMNHENNMDHNNTNNNTNTNVTTPNGTTGTGTSTNGTNTNGGTGTNGSNINSNNPR